MYVIQSRQYFLHKKVIFTVLILKSATINFYAPGYVCMSVYSSFKMVHICGKIKSLKFFFYFILYPQVNVINFTDTKFSEYKSRLVLNQRYFYNVSSFCK